MRVIKENKSTGDVLEVVDVVDSIRNCAKQTALIKQVPRPSMTFIRSAMVAPRKRFPRNFKLMRRLH